jgi:hypothetical protein
MQHLYPVLCHRVESLISAMLDIGACGGKERFGTADPLHAIKPRLGLRAILRRQAFDLLNIRNRGH